MPGKIRTAQSVSLDIPAASQPGLHNRWHPDSEFDETSLELADVSQCMFKD